MSGTMRWFHWGAGLGAACLLATSTLALAGTQCVRHIKQSPTHTVALVELYTSEGCSSCPPADRWLGQLNSQAPSSGMDADQVVPLALHVDYWDSLGWHDPFAQHAFTVRQETQTKVSHARFVYTPEVFLSGREFGDWRTERDFRAALRHLNAQPAQAAIRLALAPAAAAVGVDADFTLSPKASAASADAYIALFESGLSSHVVAGENSGATLHHDDVVRTWVGPIPLNGPSRHYQARLPFMKNWQAAHLGIAAFVQDRQTGAVLQATALPLCG